MPFLRGLPFLWNLVRMGIWLVANQVETLEQCAIPPKLHVQQKGTVSHWGIQSHKFPIELSKIDLLSGRTNFLLPSLYGYNRF
jgi:hypothetical protein